MADLRTRRPVKPGSGKQTSGPVRSGVSADAIDRLAVFAPPRFLGALRHAWSPRLAMRVDEHEGDLGYMGAGELVRHRSITRLLDNQPGT